MEELVEIRCKNAAYYREQVKDCAWLHPQFVKEGNIPSYWTYVLRLDIEKVDWHAFRKKYVELGGDGIYAAWKLSYQEPMFQNKAFLNREKLGIYDLYDYKKIHCINAEFLQPRLLQLKTNYYDLEKARQQAEVLGKTIAYFDAKM